MNLYHFLTLAFLILIFSSCDRKILDENPENDNLELFDAMWSEVNENYVFFDMKDVDWNQVHAIYTEQISSDMSDEALFAVLSGALSELKDGHVSLYSGFNTWNYYDLYLEAPANFNPDFIERTYLGQKKTIGPFTYTILESVGYLQYNSFGKDFTDEQLQYLLQYFQDTDGLIIDVRGNLGGAADNITRLMSVLVNEDLVSGKLFTPNHDGQLMEEDITIHKNEKLGTYSGEIVLLTNRQCYSSCNVFAGFMSQLSNVTIVGDTTGGGSGLAVGSELANGWRYRYSAAKITLADGTEIEEGVTPDHKVTTGPSEELQGKDALIEFSITLLK
ncbi:MAG: S41 family peptidase [Bacteroidetes bacterium]|nr:S41 family peptidase [Bacteroidota bacterium]